MPQEFKFYLKMGAGCAGFQSHEGRIDTVFKRFSVEIVSGVEPSAGIPKLVLGRIGSVNQPVVAPVSNKQVVIYRVVVEEYNPGSNHVPEGWDFRFEESQSVDFFLCDNRSFMLIPV